MTSKNNTKRSIDAIKMYQMPLKRHFEKIYYKDALKRCFKKSFNNKFKEFKNHLNILIWHPCSNLRNHLSLLMWHWFISFRNHLNILMWHSLTNFRIHLSILMWHPITNFRNHLNIWMWHSLTDFRNHLSIFSVTYIYRFEESSQYLWHDRCTSLVEMLSHLKI